MITHVAIKREGIIYSLPRPARHHDVIRHMVDEHGVPPPIGSEQGFLDDSGTFLNRMQAGQHALMCGQIEKLKCLMKDELYSEDLW